VKRTLYLDIETATQPERLAAIGMSRLMEGDDLLEWTTEHAGDEALQPHGGRVVCWAYATSDDLEQVMVDRAVADADGCYQGDELGLLTTLDARLGELAPQRICAWNGHGFDFPFLRARALHHGVDALARRLWQAKPWHDYLVDLAADDWFPRPRWGASRDWTYTLDAAAELLRVERAPTIPGRLTPAAWYRGDYDAVAAHCLDDARTLREVGRRLAAGRVA